MSTSRATRMRIDGLYCLLAEQVSPGERLLWRACPAPQLSSASHIDRYRYGSILRVAPWRVLGVSAELAALVFFNSRGRGTPTDETNISAGINAFFTFYAALFACVIGYRIVQLSRAGHISWAIWRWPAFRRSLHLPSIDNAQREGTPLVEPPAGPTFKDPVVCGLNDQRVIILIDGKLRRVHSYWIDDLQDARSIDACNGWGDLALVMKEQTGDSDPNCPACGLEYEETRLCGIPQVDRVAQALHCLIAGQHLDSALAALTLEPATSTATGNQTWQGERPTQGLVPKAHMWEATLWYGSSETQLEPCTVSGSSLDELRRHVRERLLALRPPCFSNGPAPTTQRARRTHWSQYTLYLFSPNDYQEGLFIESLGLEVEQVRLQGSLDPTSRIVADLLPLFWRFFRAELAIRRYLRFHDVLSALRQEDTLRARLRLPRHIMVDEFQDVSPEIVDWLAKTLAVQVRDGGEECSLTCIGDDYQSMYGWRGSHPIFLMEFARYFPSALEGRVVLRENFRSLQPIIDAAEAALVDVRHKIPKHGESSLSPEDGALRGSVCLSEARLPWGSRHRDASVWRVFSQFVGMVLRFLTESGHLQACFRGRETLWVFILARKNTTAKRIQPQRLGEQLIASLRESGIEGFRTAQVRVCTFHRSKGLEADFVLLIEDSLPPPEQHRLRELVFGQSPFLGRRLAYVALTRARFGVLWLPQVVTGGPDEPGTEGEQRGSETDVSPQGCFALVKRYVQARQVREGGLAR